MVTNGVLPSCQSTWLDLLQLTKCNLHGQLFYFISQYEISFIFRQPACLPCVCLCPIDICHTTTFAMLLGMDFGTVEVFNDAQKQTDHDNCEPTNRPCKCGQKSPKAQFLFLLIWCMSWLCPLGQFAEAF